MFHVHTLASSFNTVIIAIDASKQVLRVLFIRINYTSRVGLVQLFRFIVVKLTHPDSNSIFDISVIFMT
jgi:hypothetical protein